MILQIVLIHLILTLQSFLICNCDSPDELNPIHDEFNENSPRDYDKRTIFNNLHAGWAKHIAVHPSGVKYVVGFSPVDLKYVPVVKGPTKLIHFQRPPKRRPKPLKPSKPINNNEWKPVVVKPVIVKPVVPIPVKPILPVPVIHHPPPPEHPVNPWQENEWKQKPVVPVNVVHPHPAIQVVQVPQQFVPIHHHHPIHNPVITRPFGFHFHQPHLFEVARPNLPVLPLGSTFPSPVFQSNPGIFISRPLGYGFQHHHGIPTVQIQHQHHEGSHLQHPHLGLQFQHQHQLQENSPHLDHVHHLHTGVPIQQQYQELPASDHSHQAQNQESHYHQNNQEQYSPSLIHGQLPLEGDGSSFQNPNQYPPINNNQHVQHHQEHPSSNLIQPGQTDVQTPLYLPQHHSFNVLDSSQQFKPSPEIQTFNFGFNRRESVDHENHKESKEVEEEDEEDSDE